MCSSQKKHFLGFSDIVLNSSSSTVGKWSNCSSADLKKMITSSMYTITNCLLTIDSKISIASWSVLSTFSWPNDMSRSRHRPWCNITVFCPCRGSLPRVASTKNWLDALKTSVPHLMSSDTCPMRDVEEVLDSHAFSAVFQGRSVLICHSLLQTPSNIGTLTGHAPWNLRGVFFRFSH